MDPNRSVFIKNGKFLLIKREKYEPMERFNERGWFIASVLTNTQVNLDEIEKLSRIWANIKFDKCFYNDDITNKINNLSKYLL